MLLCQCVLTDAEQHLSIFDTRETDSEGEEGPLYHGRDDEQMEEEIEEHKVYSFLCLYAVH